MGKNKLAKFAELENFPHVFQHDSSLKGKWASAFFKNNNPITLELACGKGEYTVALAEKFPERNFIGVDIKGNRIWNGAKQVLEKELKNAAFLRAFIHHLDDYFEPHEIDEIWITFPDPFLRNSKANKRTTSPRFLDVYRKFLQPNGLIHLKTDSPELFKYTLEVIKEQNLEIIRRVDNVYTECPDDELLAGIQTYYERKHLAEGRTIRYLVFRI